MPSAAAQVQRQPTHLHRCPFCTFALEDPTKGVLSHAPGSGVATCASATCLEKAAAFVSGDLPRFRRLLAS